MFCHAGAKGEPGLTIAEKGLPGPRGQDGEPGLPGASGTRLFNIRRQLSMLYIVAWLKGNTGLKSISC